MKKNKIIQLIFVAVIAIFFSACGGGGSSSNTNDDPIIESSIQVIPTTDGVKIPNNLKSNN